MNNQVAEHLAHSYGVKATQVVELAQMTGQRSPVVGKKLADGYPFIEAEIVYSARNVRNKTLSSTIEFCESTFV